MPGRHARRGGCHARRPRGDGATWRLIRIARLRPIWRRWWIRHGFQGPSGSLPGLFAGSAGQRRVFVGHCLALHSLDRVARGTFGQPTSQFVPHAEPSAARRAAEINGHVEKLPPSLDRIRASVGSHYAVLVRQDPRMPSAWRLGVRSRMGVVEHHRATGFCRHQAAFTEWDQAWAWARSSVAMSSLTIFSMACTTA